MSDKPNTKSTAASKSKILAAFDNPNGFFNLPGIQVAGAKRPIESAEDDEDEDDTDEDEMRGMKRRASGQGIRGRDGTPPAIPSSKCRFLLSLRNYC